MISTNDNKKTNTVGVIPVSGWPGNLGFSWPDACMPIGGSYTAIERSILECAYAGCTSIWVVCNDDSVSLIKHRIGDYVIDPYCYDVKPYVKYFKEHTKQIPVFYTPIHPKDRERRDSLGWSVLHGCLSAFTVCSQISSWLAPKKYYVSFPYGIYDPAVVRSHKKDINCKENFFLAHEGKTVRDGMLLGFTISPREWKILRNKLKSACTGGDKKIPYYERYSSRHFTLDKIFKSDIIVVDKKKEIDSYYDLNSWASLKSFYGSSFELEKPKEKILGPFYYKGIYNIED